MARQLDMTPIRQFQDLNNTPIGSLNNRLPNYKMVALIKAVCSKMGTQSPMVAMLQGMMPLVEMKVLEVSDQNMTELSQLMAESFARVANPDIKLRDFEDWLKPIADS